MSQKIKIDQIADVTATATELNYTDGVTSNIQTQLDAKLALAGGTMSGAIAMGTNAITGMADPSSAQDAATKAYVDANAGGSVTVSSDTTTNAERLIYVGSTTTGSLSAVTQDSGLTYNPSTGSLTSAAFIGEVTGNVTGSASTATSATTAGTVTTAAQPNITSVGTLTSLDVTNNITVGGTVDGVDIASRDSVLTSTTTTANAALPKTGGAMTGAITTNSTFDGRDVATDGTKLDTIETNADVTDATNVAAAGALMTTGGSVTGNVSFGDDNQAIFGAGSDLTIKSDGVNALIQGAGTTYFRGSTVIISANGGAGGFETGIRVNEVSAETSQVELYYDNGLRLETVSGGVDVTGNITVSGTVDGRDVATDGTKLDGIATGATNVTNNNQLTNGAGYVTSSGVTSVAAGSYLTGGTITSTGTLAVNATSANTASTVVARDGSGNFSAGVITATATAARYADLAEKYTSDVQYPPGTVVELGGEAEVTRSTGPNSRKIAGIVSTDPAYLMNNDLEGDTVVDVALIGRVPCMVTGIVSKGDLLVSSSQPGHACAWTNATNPPAGSVVGKAIENKTDENPGVIEVLVGRM